MRYNRSCDPIHRRGTGKQEPVGQERPPRGFHVAIIMDGNGRWARKRRRPRRAGHMAGAAAVRRTVEAAPGLGITTLTLYAFSADNWRRPQEEVDHLMRLFQSHLRSECARCVENGVRLSVIGRRDRLPAGLGDAIEAAESRTSSGTRLHLRIAIDYSARDALMTAAASMAGSSPPSRDVFSTALARAMSAPAGTRDVDLLIRTGGERRLSDFLLWESAYAELVFTDKAWPDFMAQDLESAVREFSTRDRRFGGLALPAHARLGQSPMEGGTVP
ncbi:MAG: di-trans,poly-cis-decaprenylcistransferase [Gemmatimonadota bacterium]